MKKSLYTTTALAAASVVALGAQDATAAEKMKIGVSGSIASLVGFASQDGSFDQAAASATTTTGYDSFNVLNDSEVHFKGSTKLDNGITASVVIQLETDAINGGSTVDESYTKLTGGFGDVRIGTTKAASFVLKHRAPLVGARGIDNGDSNNWIIKPSAIAGVGNGNAHIGGGDAMKIVYITNPFAGGLRFGASYTPSNTTTDNMPAVGGTAGTETQSFDAVVSYEAKVGSVDLKADVAYYETHGNASSSSKAWRGGILLGFGAITVGGAYQDKSDLDTLITTNAMEAFDVGVQYKAGAYGVSLTYQNATSPQTAAVAGDDEVTKIALGGTYTMGPGVSLVGTVMHVDWQDELTTDSLNNSGVAVVGGIKVSF